MKKDLISIIIPCYNVEKYISKCLDTVRHQSYQNLEIILIDDGSSDKTLEIIKQAEKADQRIHVIQNEKNMGQSYSRNAGISFASGKYIGFVDSDDFIEENFYESMLKQIKKDNSNLAICDMKVFYEDSLMEVIEKAYQGTSFDLLHIMNTGLAASPCNKLFYKDFFKKYLFETGKINEDVAVVLPILAEAKISYVGDTYYYYVQRAKSTQNGDFQDKKFDIFWAVDLALERMKHHPLFLEMKDSILYNQIITFLVYTITEVPFMKRERVLKKYYQLSKKYLIEKNLSFQVFLEQCTKKHRIYYKTLLSLTSSGHSFLSSVWISMYQFASAILKKKVIKEKIDLEKVKEAAKAQNAMGKEEIKVSVIVPNYNYARFLYQRIYSILAQNYKIHELILLDDKSKDHSVEVMEAIKKEIENEVPIQLIYNNKNSGSAFKQWQKGFEVASGDYVWIAEADDYSEKNFLSELIEPIKKDKDIFISYSDTAFMDTFSNIKIRSIKKEIDIQKTKHWDKDYVNDGMEEILNFCYLNNTIANVSSCIIKNGDYSDILKEAGTYRQAGDYYFYLNIIRKGKVAYKNKTLNYYRIHGTNVSSTTNYGKHLEELNRIYEFNRKTFPLDKNQEKKMEERIKYLKNVWGIE